MRTAHMVSSLGFRAQNGSELKLLGFSHKLRERSIPPTAGEGTAAATNSGPQDEDGA